MYTFGRSFCVKSTRNPALKTPSTVNVETCSRPTGISRGCLPVRFLISVPTYQSTIFCLCNNVGLMDKDVLFRRRIVAGWRNEAKSLPIGKPLDCSLDFRHFHFPLRRELSSVVQWEALFGEVVPHPKMTVLIYPLTLPQQKNPG